MVSAPVMSFRPLDIADVNAVEAIDRAHGGHSRRRFFEKRLAAAQDHPQDYLHLGAVIDGRLKGFAISRVLRGEHGQRETVAVIDVVAVDRDSLRRGVGRALVNELVAQTRARDIGSLQSQAAWGDFALLRFFRSFGFALAPRLALERAVSELPEQQEEEA